MSMEAIASPARLTDFEQLRFARQIIQTEGRALALVAKRLDGEFCRAVGCLYECRGNVIVSGMGKAGLIGQKIMATLASTGTPSHYLHPAEALHGDLGRIQRDDVALVLSQSGETEEVLRLLPSLASLGVPIIAITARADSTLGRAAKVVLELGPLEEACPLGLAPSSSTTAMLALGDALALVTSRMRDFGREDFARFHPAGNLGQRLSKVEHHMRPLVQCRLAPDSETVREVLVRVSVPGRRTGATMLVDGEGKLSGIFTDSDLARLFEHRRDGRARRSDPRRDDAPPAPGAGRLDDGRRRGRHGRTKNQRVAGGGRGREAAGADRHHRRGWPVAPRRTRRAARRAARDDLPRLSRSGGGTANMNLDQRCQQIELILSDVDGVLTDGKIVLDNQGIEAKVYHIRDGLGIRLWQRAGCRFGIVSQRSSNSLKIRAAELGVELVRQGIKDKLTAYKQILTELGLKPPQVCYLGDDLPDLPVVRAVGLGVAVADACVELRQAAHYVTTTAGGAGAVRETVELILKAQRRWDDVIETYR